MHGIFVDESPHAWSSAAFAYSETVDLAIKNAAGLAGPRLVIHNAGIVPDTRFLAGANIDASIVSSQTYADWQSSGPASVAALGTSHLGVMLNSVPIMTKTALASFVSSVNNVAQYIYITNLSSNIYGSFGSDWFDFVVVTGTSTSTTASASSLTSTSAMASMTIVVPLYIYPIADISWAKLFTAIELRLDVSFIVVINPNSGPGSGTAPDYYYGPAIAKLNTYANVQTVGYVRTDYTRRDIDAVIADVETYAGWSSISSTYTMHGIFFDEAPYEFNQDSVTYMETIDALVKSSTGLKGAKTVIHNPGTIVDPAYLVDTNLDFTFVFEHDYDTWMNSQAAAVAALPAARGKYALMVNSVPTMTTTQLRSFVASLSTVSQYIFLTDLEVDIYESWGTDWLSFVAVANT
ncbi:hypothetical protein PFICI_04432 [Pestalotiopsis fici W106-1]|uniref:Uncharacterized protein n=1 Tax=Pestalotiopsis fici (strain W106-1 / CGMCC3.15140) TaxID=1229662 RepID=W3XBJ1_PESFW|nr:uncharacterized protein PFICI_04432 [Pestalotiopsis fici W106-1]ETS82556.1 hypothetical protein PFICI_04432 [Pestalotiopsis fici W106-1]